MSMNPEALQALASAVKAAQASADPAELGKIYEGLVGYDAYKDDPAQSADDLRDLVCDYVREVCYDAGVGVAAVGLGDE